MTDVQFKIDQLNKKFFHGDIGATFQKFVHELLLPEYPKLHIFPTGGKDGGIDISEKRENSSTFIECKYITKDGFDAAYSRWKEIAKHLENHISNPLQPTIGQRQYSPWYCTEFPVTEYLFCISSILANEDQVRRLYKEIKDFFIKLSNNHNHLAHLASVSVQVLDWNDLCIRLLRYPHILLRWFPRIRPNTLIPLEDVSEIGSFRAYLHSDILPYYARHEHLKLFPGSPNSIIPDEQALLLELSDDDIAGLIITGKGGVGKTRLTLEIGRLALKSGWIVLQCSRKVVANDVMQLTETITDNQQVLILVDYIEIQNEFNEFVENIVELNKEDKFRIRYVANCRTNFYHTLPAYLNFRQLNLSPVSHDDDADWVQSFQREVVNHILKSSQIDIKPEHLQICRNRPAFAAFLSYLNKLGRSDELTELLGEKDFSGWVAKRLQLTFGKSVTTRKLALFMMLFPLSDSSYRSDDDFLQVLHQLAADGWIEKNSVADKDNQIMWVVAHDVLADQIILSYLNSIPDTVETFLQHALAETMRLKSFRSAVVALQRIVDQAPLKYINWFNILARFISGEQIEMLDHDRAVLMRTSLLTPHERIKLLDINEYFWKGIEEKTEFQNTIGWLARWVQGEEQSSIDDGDRTTLTLWLSRAAQHALESNYILTSGLRFYPEVVRDASFNWISTRPQELQTHYLIVAWLENGLPPAEIELYVWLWTTHFMHARQLSFVASSWLEAGGDYELISDNILEWLGEFGVYPEAQFIYCAWLKTEGELKLIKEHLNKWLMKNATRLEASFIYWSWLTNRKSLYEISSYFSSWLDVHCEKVETSLILRLWLSKRGDKAVVKEYIKRWLHIWGNDSRAVRVYSEWISAGGDWETVRNYIINWLSVNREDIRAAVIYRLWLKHEREKDWIKPLIINWIQTNSSESIAVKIYIPWLKFYGETAFISPSILAWLQKHSTHLQAGFLLDAWVKAGGQFSTIISYVFIWLENNWDVRVTINLIELILRQDELVPNTIENLLHLCINNPNSVNSFRCLSKIIVSPHRSDYIDTIYNVFMTLLNNIIASNEMHFKGQRDQIAKLLGLLLENIKLSNEDYRKQINILFVQWLRNPSFLDYKFRNSQTQTPEYLYHIREALAEGTLTINHDIESLKHILYWINDWSANIKLQLREDLEFLSINFPAPHLWNTVKF